MQRKLNNWGSMKTSSKLQKMEHGLFLGEAVIIPPPNCTAIEKLCERTDVNSSLQFHSPRKCPQHTLFSS